MTCKIAIHHVSIFLLLFVRQSLGQKHEACPGTELGSYQSHFASDQRKMEKQCVVHHKVDISTTDESDHQELSQAEITAWSIFEQIGFSLPSCFPFTLSTLSCIYCFSNLVIKSIEMYFISFLNFHRGNSVISKCLNYQSIG